MRIDPEQRKIIKSLCEKYQLTEEEVLEIIKAPFRFIRKTTASLELEGVTNEEEFYKATKNFNLPSIGKMYAHYNNYLRWQKKK